jgi:hypothetical protein
MSASKMSRSIKNKIIFNNDYYYRCSNWNKINYIFIIYFIKKIYF